MKCVIVLPCYNEEGNVKTLINTIDRILSPHMPYQIIAVNDGSNDYTGDFLQELSKEYPIRVLEHRTNKGLGVAFRLGLSEAVECSSDGDLIVTMDSDNTHEPRYILDMIRAAKEADIVIGSRYIRGANQLNVPFRRRILSKTVNFLIGGMAKLPVRDATSGFRCFRASALKRLRMFLKHKFIESKGFEVSLEILVKTFWCNSVIKEVPITLDFNKRKGSSKMQLLPTIKRYIQLLGEMKAWRTELEENGGSN